MDRIISTPQNVDVRSAYFGIDIFVPSTKTIIKVPLQHPEVRTALKGIYIKLHVKSVLSFNILKLSAEMPVSHADHGMRTQQNVVGIMACVRVMHAFSVSQPGAVFHLSPSVDLASLKGDRRKKDHRADSMAGYHRIVKEICKANFLVRKI